MIKLGASNFKIIIKIKIVSLASTDNLFFRTNTELKLEKYSPHLHCELE